LIANLALRHLLTLWVNGFLSVLLSIQTSELRGPTSLLRSL